MTVQVQISAKIFSILLVVGGITTAGLAIAEDSKRDVRVVGATGLAKTQGLALGRHAIGHIEQGLQRFRVVRKIDDDGVAADLVDVAAPWVVVLRHRHQSRPDVAEGNTERPAERRGAQRVGKLPGAASQ